MPEPPEVIAYRERLVARGARIERIMIVAGQKGDTALAKRADDVLTRHVKKLYETYMAGAWWRRLGINLVAQR